MIDPYISVIVTTRNDNYGENMRQRLEMFVQGLDEHEKKYPGLFELVIVEWNPPEDQESLEKIIPDCDHLPIRMVTVPSEYHRRTGLKRPVAEYLAKNVGIRHSQGQFVLVSNPDILYSYNLVDHLAKKDLQENVIYRCDRYDFNGIGIDQIEPQDYIRYAFNRIFRLHGMFNRQSLTVDIDMSKQRDSMPISTYSNETLHTNGAGDFMLMSKSTAEKVGGLYQGNDCPGHGDSASMMLLVKKGVAQGIFRFPQIILHHDHDRDEQRPAFDPTHILNVINGYSCDDWGLVGENLQEWRNRAD